MSQTLLTSFSDAEIRRQAANSEVRDLRDARYPGVYFRFHQNRERGTWHLVVGKKWEKIAGFPELPVKGLINALPKIRERLATDPKASAAAGTLQTVGQLLEWFMVRQSTERSLSAKRRATNTSIITCHLKPRLSELLIDDVDRSTLDKLVMWPMQAEMSLSYVRLMWGVLVVAFRQAERLRLIAQNPVAGFKFTDFTKARILPKPSRLRAVQLEEVLGELAVGFDQHPQDCMLALMMLCHGTRAGETRQARWSHLTLGEQGEWFIPAENTKTRCEHRLPLTHQACALLERYRDWQSSKGYKGAYMFPARNRGPISDSQACAVFARLGKGEWTSHDLRKVARTGWTDLGVDFLIGEMLVNHTLTRNVQTYIHTSAELLKREALNKWHEWLDGKGFSRIHRSTLTRNENSHNAVEANTGAASSAITNP
ncbi:tyrosine-type recombinase/integrase [Pseudomonas tremae]|uniref:Prophage PssSM-03, phage integrase protein n=2 Tax=Pseudomonas syringae group TaxID=136849 RepID=A0AB37QSL6_9PSED|nr:site-specific integrase [Pseudomonas coronafaciens]RMS02535.1 Prophage PssSM-03, phage integrase protein [Pseudomonas coronafaciens pv. garcae]RMS28397.1 Prophage PssSM-03, phage integrase protein [Pseudomonas coronafaciens pv. garcae]